MELDGSPSNLFVPVIVTNANIYTTRYQPTEVSLDTGQLSALPSETDAADVVHFQRTFVTETRFDLGAPPFAASDGCVDFNSQPSST